MNISLERKIAVGLGAALILLLGVGFVSYRSTTNLIDRETRVAHAHQVREAIEHQSYRKRALWRRNIAGRHAAAHTASFGTRRC
jgi:hypothetical protein